MNCSLPGSSVRGISQAAILEWVGIFSFRGSSQPRDQTHGSCHVSCIAGGFFTTGATWKAPSSLSALVSETGIIVISMVPTLEILVLKFNRSVLVNCFM